MTKLVNALKSYQQNLSSSDEFSKTLKQEIEALKGGSLPLELATCQGGIVDDSNIAALINHVTETDNTIQARVGIFFNEIIAGCNCDDDPMAENTYCELLVCIDKSTAETDFTILS